MRNYTLIMVLLVFATGCQTIPPTPINHALKTSTPTGEIFATDMSFDSATGKIEYTLPEAALVRIRIGITNGGPLLVTPLDWEPREKGRHTEIWNHKDASGTIDFSGRTDLMVVIFCRTQDPARAQLRKVPRVSIGFPEAAKSADGLPVLRGSGPVRVALNDEDKNWLTKTKFEVALYVDYVYLMEDEEGTSPFTYQLNVKGLNNGLHTFTATMMGYDGDVATETKTFYVEN